MRKFATQKKFEEKHKIALILRDKSKFRLFELKQKKPTTKRTNKIRTEKTHIHKHTDRKSNERNST